MTLKSLRQACQHEGDGISMTYPSFSEQMRILRSFEISVIRRSENHFEAKNNRNHHKYVVLFEDGKLKCQCPDSHRTDRCKHVYAVEAALEVFNAAEVA
jgi:hypothetical protein